MTAQIVVEVMGPSGNWVTAGPPVTPTGRPGSVASDDPAAGRQVYLFGWLDADGRAGLWRSRAGADIEDPAVRAVMSVGGLQQLADLELLDVPVELDIWLGGVPLRVRLRLAEEPDP